MAADECDGGMREEEGDEGGGDDEVEIHSARNFFSPAVLMFYACNCCAYFKGLLDMVYCIDTHTHTHAQDGTLSLQSTALYGVL